MTVTSLRMTALAPTTKRGFVVGILASLKECRTNLIGAISLGRNQFPEGAKTRFIAPRTGSSNPLPSSGESASRAILPSHGEKPAFRAGVGPAGASARQQLGATRDVARPDRFSGDQASERSLRPAASFDIGRLFGVSHRLATLKRRRLRRGHRWQLVHDRPEPGVGFGLKAAMPSRRDEIADRVIAGIAQGPH